MKTKLKIITLLSLKTFINSEFYLKFQRQIRLFMILFVITTYSILNSQENDTNFKRINSMTDDTLKIIEFNEYAWKLKTTNPYKSTILAENNLKVSKKINYKMGQSISLNTLGAINLLQGNYQQAMEYYHNALKINNEIYNIEGIGRNYNNIAIIYNRQGNYDKALEYNLKALSINEKLKNDELIANSYNNIGNIYTNLHKFEKSLEYHNKSLLINLKLKDKDAIARSYGNIGQVYKELAQNDLILLDTAIKYLNLAIEIYRELNDDYSLTINLINLSDCYKLEKKYDKALELLNLAKDLSNKLGAKQLILDTYRNFYKTYEAKSNYKLAFEYQSLYNIMSDSVFNEDKALEIGKVEGRYELELQLEKKRQEEKLAEEKKIEEINRTTNLQYSAIFIFIIIVFISVFLLGQFVASDKVIEAVIFLSFIILFEFLLVLLDPFMDNYTNGLPIFSLIFNISVALLIFPLHHYFEMKLKDIVKENRDKKLKLG